MKKTVLCLLLALVLAAAALPAALAEGETAAVTKSDTYPFYYWALDGAHEGGAEGCYPVGGGQTGAQPNKNILPAGGGQELAPGPEENAAESDLNQISLTIQGLHCFALDDYTDQRDGETGYWVGFAAASPAENSAAGFYSFKTADSLEALNAAAWSEPAPNEPLFAEVNGRVYGNDGEYGRYFIEDYETSGDVKYYAVRFYDETMAPLTQAYYFKYDLKKDVTLTTGCHTLTLAPAEGSDWGEAVDLGKTIPCGARLSREQLQAQNPGYELAGLYKDAAKARPWDFEADRVTNKTTLYADWEKLPDPVARIGEVTYTSLTEALDQAADGQTVTVIAPAAVDREDTYALTGKSVILDLNGQTVTWTSPAKEALSVKSGGLTIRDSAGGGALNIESSCVTTSNSGVSVGAGGSLRIEGGAVTYSAVKTGRAVCASGSGAVSMSGGTVNISGSAMYGLYLTGTGRHQLSGGSVLLNGGASSSILYGVYGSLSTGGALELSGLNVDASAVPAAQKVFCAYGYNDNTSVVVSAGSFTANENQSSFAVGSGTKNDTAISGGVFHGAVKASAGGITGGQFSVLPSVDYLAGGKIFEQDGGFYRVTDGSYAASTGGRGYLTWEELFRDVAGSGNVNVEILSPAEEIEVPAGVQVSLNDRKGVAVGRIVNNGSCRVFSFDMPDTAVVNNGTFTLESGVGSVTNNAGASFTAGKDTSKVFGSIVNHGELNISKGVYSGSVTSDRRANITGGTFAADVKDVCAEGYTTRKLREGGWQVAPDDKAARIGEYWYPTLAAALKDARSGETVELLKDVSLKEEVSITDRDVTLDAKGRTITLTGEPSYKNASIDLYGTARLKVTGSPVFTFDEAYNTYNTKGRIFTVNGDSRLTLENGSYYAGLTCVLADENAEAVILGGRYAASGKYDGVWFLLNLQDGCNAKFRVFGGEFVNYDPADSRTEAPAADFCAPGYAATPRQEGGDTVYTVAPGEAQAFAAEVNGLKYLTVAEALADAQPGCTLTLLARYEGEPVTISQPMTILLGQTGTAADRFLPGENYQVTADETGAVLVFDLRTFTVKFESNGGSPVPAQTVRLGAAAAEPATPTREGFLFGGWYSDEALTAAYDFASGVTADVILYAKWAPAPTPVPTPSPAPTEKPQEGGGSDQTPAPTATPAPAAATPAPAATARPVPTGEPTATAAPGEGGEGTGVTATVPATVTDSAATAAVDSDLMNDSVRQALEQAAQAGEAPSVTVELEVAGKARSLEVTLPVEALAPLADAEGGVLTLTSGLGEVTFDPTALSALVEQAGGELAVTVEAMDADSLTQAQAEAAGDFPVFALRMRSGDELITDLGGGFATVTLPYELTGNEQPEGVLVLWLDEEGRAVPCETIYDETAATVTFTAATGAAYAVTYDESLVPGPTPAPTQAPDQPADGSMGGLPFLPIALGAFAVVLVMLAVAVRMFLKGGDEDQGY